MSLSLSLAYTLPASIAIIQIFQPCHRRSNALANPMLLILTLTGPNPEETASSACKRPPSPPWLPCIVEPHPDYVWSLPRLHNSMPPYRNQMRRKWMHCARKSKNARTRPKPPPDPGLSWIQTAATTSSNQCSRACRLATLYMSTACVDLALYLIPIQRLSTDMPTRDTGGTHVLIIDMPTRDTGGTHVLIIDMPTRDTCAHLTRRLLDADVATHF